MKFLTLILTVLLAGCNLAIAQSPYATRLPAELQTAQMDSLADVTWLQGTTPAIRVEPLLRGRPVAVDADTTVRMVIGPSATGTLYAVRTNLAAVTNAYEIQWPTIGTNSAGEAWFYTLLFDREGYTYWSGSGSLYIEETTSTASNGLAWIEYTIPNVGWANVMGDPADNAALVQYVEDHGGGEGDGTGWTNLAFSGTGNAITGATAAGTTLTLERGTIEGGGGGGTSTNEVRAIRDEAFRPYTTLGLSGGTALVTRASGQWIMIEADDGAVTLDVDLSAYTNSLEAIRHQICWVRGTNETYTVITNNIDNTLFVDLPASTTNHLFLERRPGWPRFQIWQDFR